MAVVGSKYTLESVMEEIQTIKSTQQRYAEQYLQPQTAGSASLSFVCKRHPRSAAQEYRRGYQQVGEDREGGGTSDKRE